MKRKLVLGVVGAALAIATAGGAAAHHAFSNAYSAELPLTLKGQVTFVRMLTPHSYIVVRVQGVDASGAPKAGSTLDWAFEVDTPNLLAKLGLTKDVLQNRTVTVAGYQSRDKLCSQKHVALQSGLLDKITCDARALTITFENGCVLPLADVNSGVPGSRSDRMKALAESPCKP